MSRKHALRLLTMLVLTVLLGCQTSPQVAPTSGVTDLTVTETGATFGNVRLRISGRLVDSARTVVEVQTVESDQAINIRVLVGFQGSSPNFEREIEVPWHVERVTFGPDQRIIWRRPD